MNYQPSTSKMTRLFNKSNLNPKCISGRVWHPLQISLRNLTYVMAQMTLNSQSQQDYLGSKRYKDVSLCGIIKVKLSFLMLMGLSQKAICLGIYFRDLVGTGLIKVSLNCIHLFSTMDIKYYIFLLDPLVLLILQGNI